MNGNAIALIVALALLLGASAFFSASETAYSSLNRIRIKNLASQGNTRAKRALGLVAVYDRLLSTVLIGNNIVNITASALATVLFVGYLGNAGVTVATVVTTVLVLIFGEISPKTLAKEAPEQFALIAAAPLHALVVLFTPLNFFFSKWKELVLRIFKISSNRSITEEELLTFVHEAQQEGGINQQEENMIRHAIEFDELEAIDICTPRVDIRGVEENATVQEIARTFFETGFSRLPVYRQTVDDVVGVILQKDFHFRVEGQGRPLADILRKVLFITRSVKIPQLLAELQKHKLHMAVILDEYGGTTGIVTIEDIVEELVGEIWDEHDEVVEWIRKTGEKEYTILGTADPEDVFALLSISQETDAGSFAGWVLEQLSRIPKEGDTFEVQGVHFTVAKTLRHRVTEVKAVLP